MTLITKREAIEKFMCGVNVYYMFKYHYNNKHNPFGWTLLEDNPKTIDARQYLLAIKEDEK